MILATHVIFGAYGFWLPNDPCGSWSQWVGSWDLFRYGPATKTDTRRSVAGAAHNRQARLAAKESLKFPAVRFTDEQIAIIAEGFDQARQEGPYAIHACAILPDHVHLVVGRHERDIKRIVGHLKARVTQNLRIKGLWPDDDRPIWAAKCWKVYLDSTEDMNRAIRYVEYNPVKEGRPIQKWSFVVPFLI